MNKWFESKYIFLLLLPGMICLVLPTNNSTQDAFGYAADAKYGIDLFSAHHLLYTAHLYLFKHIIAAHNVLVLGKLINALYLFGCMIMLYQILKKHNAENNTPIFLSFFAGCSFASLRFATENETYIIPIFFSLVGTFFYAGNTKKSYLLSGFFMAFACLFHQIQFFWWLIFGLWIWMVEKQRPLYHFMMYSISALIVPLCYVLVVVFYYHQAFSFATIWQFTFQTFYNGAASLDIDLMYSFRFVVSILRTFLQFHPSIWLWVSGSILLECIGISLVVALGYYLYKSLKAVSFNQFNTNSIVYLLIIALNLAYSLLGGGNSEFMVMVPFLVCLVIHEWIKNISIHFFIFSCLMLCWNVVFGLLPAHFMVLQPYQKWVNRVKANPNAIYILRDATETNSIIYYETGFFPKNCMIIEQFQHTKIQPNQLLYTDYLSEPIIKNSAYYLLDTTQISKLDSFLFVKVDSIELFGKKQFLFRGDTLHRF